MPKKTVQGVGMRAVELPDPKDRAAVLAAWDAFDAALPVAQPGEVGGDSLRRANAEAMVTILRNAGLPDDPRELRRQIAARGFAEDSREHLAADWLRAWRWWHHARKQLLAGDVTPATISAITDAGQAMGEIIECWWWRVGVDSATGERREALALRGIRHTRPNAGQQNRTSERMRFLDDLAREIGTRKHDAIAEEAVTRHRRRVHKLWPEAGDRSHTIIMNFLRNHPLP